MPIFKSSVVINAPIQKVYHFHIDTHNLKKITPPWIDVTIASIALPLHVNSEILLDIRRFGLMQRWQMQIAVMQEPDLVKDCSLKSPFKRFEHEHRFTMIDEDHTLMEDHIIYELPLYPLSMLVYPLIAHDLKKMFDYRHKITKEILERKLS